MEPVEHSKRKRKIRSIIVKSVCPVCNHNGAAHIAKYSDWFSFCRNGGNEKGTYCHCHYYVDCLWEEE